MDGGPRPMSALPLVGEDAQHFADAGLHHALVVVRVGLERRLPRGLRRGRRAASARLAPWVDRSADDELANLDGHGDHKLMPTLAVMPAAASSAMLAGS